jgi:hemerythrin-like metal-binding protein
MVREMEDIIWDSSWNIGHAEIDTQHQKWIEILNRLQRSVFCRNDKDINEVQRNTLKEILDYTRYHFDSEEKLMKATSYPDSYNHWRLHKDFDNLVYEKNRALAEGAIILNSELLSLMKNWLLQHIQVEDQKFGCYLLSNSKTSAKRR